MSGKRVTKRWQKALELVYAREIHGILPHVSKAKVFTELQEAGMVQPMERTFGAGVFAVTVNGWALTQLGRFTYCVCCE